MKHEKLHAVVANFEVEMHKSPRVQSTFGSGDVEQVHPVVARSTLGSQNAQKNIMFGALFEVAMWKKCMPLWREAHFQVRSVKNSTCSDHFWTFRCRLAWQAQGIVRLVKVVKT